MQSNIFMEPINIYNLDHFNDPSEEQDEVPADLNLDLEYDYKGNNDLISQFNFNNLFDNYCLNQDKIIIDSLIIRNIGLVRKIALKYLNYLGNTHTFEDLVSEGILGLIKAIEKFDPLSGYDFLTYATYWIRLVIARSIIDTGTIIRVPVHLVELIIKIKKIEYFYKLTDSAVDITTICKRLQISPERYQEAKLIEYRYLYLIDFEHRQITELEDCRYNKLEDLDEADDLDDWIFPQCFAANPSFEEAISDPALIFEELDFKVFIRKTLTTLSERECNIIKLRFGFNDGNVKTLQEVAEIYGLTRERVRQIEIKALQKLMLKLFKIKKYWTA